MAYFLTRLNVGDYDSWKPMFDQDGPGARRDAKGHRLFRNVDDPGEVYILVEFGTAEEAKEGRERLLASGVLDRFEDKSGPTIVEEAEAVTY
jgi:hypothetical protein